MIATILKIGPKFQYFRILSDGAMNFNDNQNRVGVLGATSFVGVSLLQRLANQGQSVVAFSRREGESTKYDSASHIQWQKLSLPHPGLAENNIHGWICLAPIAILPDYFSLLEAYGAKRVVVLSSTSRFTKNNSSDSNEQRLAVHLAEAEARVEAWAESRGIEWIILRPTLIYGLGRDRNISEIARIIRRFGLFPLFNQALGLRQPVHTQDVANACWLALQASASVNRAYNISGAEIITYREMVSRIFIALDKRIRLLSIPFWLFNVVVNILRCLPRYRKWSCAMVERMNYDMVFDYSDAERDFGFKPRSFKLDAEDIPL